MTRLLIWFTLAFSAAATECITVTGDTIVARDLAKAVPEFESAPPDVVLSFAPIPGLTRAFRISEIAMFAKRFQITLKKEAARDVCFLSAAAVLTEDQIRAAILPAIHERVVSMKILDFSRSPVPPAKIEFRPAGLIRSSLNSPGTIFWQGRVVMQSGHSFPIWAKLSIVVETKIVVSTREILKDRALTAEDVAFAEEAPFPLPKDTLTSLDGVAGQISLRNIAKGTPILKSMLELPKEVLQGQVVQVEAICGEARLSFEARAEMSGRHGDLITVLNPNGRSFRARVIDKARVEVRSLTGD
jgi:flagella basal body P-ring formation protein FlgA